MYSGGLNVMKAYGIVVKGVFGFFLPKYLGH